MVTNIKVLISFTVFFFVVVVYFIQYSDLILSEVPLELSLGVLGERGQPVLFHSALCLTGTPTLLFPRVIGIFFQAFCLPRICDRVESSAPLRVLFSSLSHSSIWDPCETPAHQSTNTFLEMLMLGLNSEGGIGGAPVGGRGSVLSSRATCRGETRWRRTSQASGTCVWEDLREWLRTGKPAGLGGVWVMQGSLDWSEVRLICEF